MGKNKQTHESQTLGKTHKRYYFKQHANRVPKCKLLETSVTLPTTKVHRRDDSEQMDCDEVSSLTNCSGTHDNCERPTKSWYEAVISYVVDLMLE